MGLAFGILTVCAGIVYVVWQYKKENPGMITLILVAWAIFLGPFLIWDWVSDNVNLVLGLVGIATHGLLGAGFCFYMAFRSNNIMSKETREHIEIWNEVNALPIPDAETLRRYKIANHIPLVPEDCKTYNDAAIRAWRIDEHNKRFEKRHRLVVKM